MTLADKRKVIEVLLCGASIGCVAAAYSLDVENRLERSAARLRSKAMPSSDQLYVGCFMEAGIEAAYRLIESSPTLRREWFGAR